MSNCIYSQQWTFWKPNIITSCKKHAKENKYNPRPYTVRLLTDNWNYLSEKPGNAFFCFCISLFWRPNKAFVVTQHAYLWFSDINSILLLWFDDINKSLSSVCHSNQHGHWFTIVSHSDGRVFTLPKLGTDTGSGQMLNGCSGPHGLQKTLCAERAAEGLGGGGWGISKVLQAIRDLSLNHRTHRLLPIMLYETWWVFCLICWWSAAVSEAAFVLTVVEMFFFFKLIFSMYELKELISTDAKINKC